MISRTGFVQSPVAGQGFTLLELVVTLAITSILITIGYPSYTQYVIKTNRSQAEIALLDVASGLERYFTLNNTYAGATLADAQVNAYTENQHYQLVIASATQNNYQVNAMPLGAQASDVACGVLSLNESGEKGISGTGSVGSCW